MNKIKIIYFLKFHISHAFISYLMVPNFTSCTKVVELKLDDGGEVVRSVSFEVSFICLWNDQI